MRHSSPNRPSRDPHHFCLFLLRNMLWGIPKRSFRFFEKLFAVSINIVSVSTPKTTQKIENDTVGRYRFI